MKQRVVVAVVGIWGAPVRALDLVEMVISYTKEALLPV
jgi:hypothetical protein